MLIEADDANEQCGRFKLAGKLGQENDHSMQVPIPPSPGYFSAINVPVVNLPAESQQADDATPSGPRSCVDVRRVAQWQATASVSNERHG